MANPRTAYGVSHDAVAHRSPTGRTELREELERTARRTLRSGRASLLEDEFARHWEIRLAPGERIGFHRHVLDYVWTCVSGGTAISHTGDGETLEVTYAVGETRRLSFGPGEWMVHDLANAGDAH